MARKKGDKNRKTFQVEELAQKYELEPFDFAMAVMNGDWKLLGFKEQAKISYSPAGIEFEEPNIKLSDRMEACKFAGKYLYSPKQAVDPITGNAGITVKIVDYTKK